MKDKNDTLIHSKLNKEVNLFKYQFTLGTFVTDNKFNAKGRFYLDVVLILFFLISYNEEAPFIRGAFWGLISLVLPIIITQTIKYVMNEFKPAKDNLYDFLLGIGSFGISIVATIAVFYMVCRLIYKHIALPSVLFPVLSAAGLLGAIFNFILMKKQRL